MPHDALRHSRILAAIAVVLAGICVILAVAYGEVRREADCWRDLAQDNDWPAEGTCEGKPHLNVASLIHQRALKPTFERK